MRRAFLAIPVIIAALSLTSCASLTGYEPLQVTVAGIDSLPGEGLEVRMLVKLRVQNPNETAVDYDGVYVKLDVANSTFATGVSDARGSVPRFGESVIEVPVTISAVRVALRALEFVRSGAPSDKINYRLSGKLDGPTFGAMRFQTDGEIGLPKLQ